MAGRACPCSGRSPVAGRLFGIRLGGAAGPTDLDADAVNDAKAAADNAVSRLVQRLDAGRATLTRDDDHGYLRSILRELTVPESSQVLVFSKTSLQRHRIGPKTPRAV